MAPQLYFYLWGCYYILTTLHRIFIKITGLSLCSAGMWVAIVMTQLFMHENEKHLALIWYIPVMTVAGLLILAGLGLVRAKDWQEVKDTIHDYLWLLWLAR